MTAKPYNNRPAKPDAGNPPPPAEGEAASPAKPEAERQHPKAVESDNRLKKAYGDLRPRGGGVDRSRLAEPSGRTKSLPDGEAVVPSAAAETAAKPGEAEPKRKKVDAGAAAKKSDADTRPKKTDAKAGSDSDSVRLKDSDPEGKGAKKADPEAEDDDSVRDVLWTKTRAGDRNAYEALVDSYLPLVKVTVSRMAINLPTFISREELYSAGCVGLVSAVERYDPGRDARFTTYAITRIRGAVLDELRSHDVLGRVVRDRVNRIERVEAELLSANSLATPEEIAEAAGLTMDEYWDAEMGAQAAKRVSLSDTGGASGRRSLEDVLLSNRDDYPGARLEAEEILEVVMGLLTEKEKQLVVMYYEEELTLKEIGDVLKVTESRVCQIHAAMLQKIRKKLEKMGIPV